MDFAAANSGLIGRIWQKYRFSELELRWQIELLQRGPTGIRTRVDGMQVRHLNRFAKKLSPTARLLEVPF